jgi:hypothetical protein
MGRADLATDQDEFEPLRELMTEALDEMGLGEIDVAIRLSDYEPSAEAILNGVVPYLSAVRGRLLGDTAALPVFFLSFFSFRAAGAMAFRDPLDEYNDLLETCLDDLGIGKDFLRVLEKYVGFVLVQEVDGEPTVNRGQITLAAVSFLEEALQRLVAIGDADDLKGLLTNVASDIRDFRSEFREQTNRLEYLVREGNATISAAIADVEALLIANGMTPAEASALTADDPSGFWERVIRWVGSAGPRDAAEAAFWVALDFVPGGTGVKIGFKVAQAIRGSLKGA